MKTMKVDPKTFLSDIVEENKNVNIWQEYSDAKNAILKVERASSYDKQEKLTVLEGLEQWIKEVKSSSRSERGND